MTLKIEPDQKLSQVQNIVAKLEALRDKLQEHQTTIEALNQAHEITGVETGGLLGEYQKELVRMEKTERLLTAALAKVGVLCDHCEGGGKADGGRDCFRCIGRGVVFSTASEKQK